MIFLPDFIHEPSRRQERVNIFRFLRNFQITFYYLHVTVPWRGVNPEVFPLDEV